MSKKVLIIGNGAREHTIAWKLAQSEKVSDIFVAPGNGGITTHGGKIIAVDIKVNDHSVLLEYCKNNSIDLVVVGPEDPLAKGVSDYLNSNGVACFGPSKEASRIESDKAFAKNFMKKYAIPTAQFQNFTDPTKAKQYVESTGALVIKASGLAAGKGVIVAKSKQEAIQAIDDIMVKRIFGDAGNEVVVEEFLEGEEVSVFAITDGTHFQLMKPAQDHKRAFVGDKGPNTGGMGAYCPYPFLEPSQMETIAKDIVERTLTGMRQEGHPFVGLLFAGLMITSSGPKVIEFNCRFGDPETQSVLTLLKSDLYDMFVACLSNNIKSIQMEFKDEYAVGVVVVSGGYPGSYQKNIEIHGLDTVKKLNVLTFHSGTVFRDGKYYTSGGRVLTVVAFDTDFKKAVFKATAAASQVKFANAFYRNDIGHRTLQKLENKVDYKSSGVDIDAGNRLVEHIKKFAKQTNRPGVMEQIGGFGALFDLKKTNMKDPILVSGTDGVGTKLKIAIDTGKLETVGIDLVAMCVNDIIVQGAEPLFFLDYFACNSLKVEKASMVIKGISEGCLQANSALIGGETAEMPGMYAEGDFDLAGFAVGVVERDQILPRKELLSPGDVLIGLSSSGVHSNGFSLVRKIMKVHSLNYDDVVPFDPSKTFGDLLLTPTKIYVKSIMPLIKANKLIALSHITGGGLLENIPRILPDNLAVEMDAAQWPILPIFTWLKTAGNLEENEILKTLNCGLGMVLLVKAGDVDHVLKTLKAHNETGHIVGKVVHRQSEAVTIRNFTKSALVNEAAIFRKSTSLVAKKRVAVLISGTGTNLKAIIDYVMANSLKSAIDLVMVVSDKKNAPGLRFAEEAGIPTKVIIKKKEQTREEYDQLVSKVLVEANIELVCLAGFMRLLSEEFVNTWLRRMVNIHPSILPSFKGVNAYGQALEYGVKITGCTVHFVTTEMDAGPIILQDIIYIQPEDTVDSLTERGKIVENNLYPRALELVASGKVSMSEDGKLVVH